MTKDILITKFPVVIFTDSHTNIANIKKLRELYPTNQMICLGDITFLFSKPGELYNQRSIEYFIDNDIPCLEGNHDQHIMACKQSDDGNSTTSFKVIPVSFTDDSLFDNYGLDDKHIEYLQKLPRGFKLILPDGSNYLCFHNRPNDLWGFTEENTLTTAEFLEIYPIDDKTRAVLIGHHHRNFRVEYDGSSTKLIAIGRLSKENDYALLTERGIEFKKI